MHCMRLSFYLSYCCRLLSPADLESSVTELQTELQTKLQTRVVVVLDDVGEALRVRRRKGRRRRRLYCMQETTKDDDRRQGPKSPANAMACRLHCKGSCLESRRCPAWAGGSSVRIARQGSRQEYLYDRRLRQLQSTFDAHTSTTAAPCFSRRSRGTL